MTIFDREKKLVDVHLSGGKAYCDLCEEFDCKHICFALSLSKVVEPLREKGWVIRDRKVILPHFQKRAQAEKKALDQIRYMR